MHEEQEKQQKRKNEKERKVLRIASESLKK